MRFSPCFWIVGSATPNWSTRFRMTLSPWSTKELRRSVITFSFSASSMRPAAGSWVRVSNSAKPASACCASWNACGRGQLDDDAGASLSRDLGADALLLERRPQVDGHAVEHVLDPLVEVDAEDEVDAALQVQPEVDRLAGLAPPVAG